jgi:hypothetical protein
MQTVAVGIVALLVGFVGGAYYFLQGGPFPQFLIPTSQESPMVSASIISTSQSMLTARLADGSTKEFPLKQGARVITVAPEPPTFPIGCLMPDDMVQLRVKDGAVTSVQANNVNATEECITAELLTLPPEDPSYVAP